MKRPLSHLTYTVVCPKCRSGIGYKCLTPGGDSMVHPHGLRIEEVRKLLGISKGQYAYDTDSAQAKKHESAAPVVAPDHTPDETRDELLDRLRTLLAGGAPVSQNQSKRRAADRKADPSP